MKSTKEWISISDMMTGLMMVFLFISVLSMVQIQKESEEKLKATKKNISKIQEIIDNYSYDKILILKELKKEFEKDLKKWENAEIIDHSLTIRFVSPDIMFEPKSSFIKPEFKKILSDFCPRYFNLLYQMKNSIEEIRIEGHTSYEWGKLSKREAYFKNMKLSQDRSRAVLSYCARLKNIRPEINGWAIKKLTANGLSSSRPICKEDWVKCRYRNRRVEFRIQVNESVLLNKIIKTVKEIFSQSLSPKKEQPEEQNKK